MRTFHEYIRSRCTGVHGPMLNNRFQWVGQHELYEKYIESIRGPIFFELLPFVIDYPFSRVDVSMSMYLPLQQGDDLLTAFTFGQQIKKKPVLIASITGKLLKSGKECVVASYHTRNINYEY